MPEYAFYFWIGAAVLLFILELCISSGFYLLCFSVGAAVAAFIALAGLGLVGDILVFIAFSILAFLFIRPVVMKRMDERSSKRPKTNQEALIGRRATVVEAIPQDGMGRVKIDGDIWQAHTPDHSPLPVGALAEVIAIDSIVLTVRAI